jgi:hypothetical protein
LRLILHIFPFRTYPRLFFCDNYAKNLDRSTQFPRKKLRTGVCDEKERRGNLQKNCQHVFAGMARRARKTRGCGFFPTERSCSFDQRGAKMESESEKIRKTGSGRIGEVGWDFIVPDLYGGVSNNVYPQFFYTKTKSIILRFRSACFTFTVTTSPRR